LKDTTVLLIVLVVAFVLVAPSFLKVLSDTVKEIGDWVKYGWEDGDGDGTTGSQVNGSATSVISGLTFRLTYKDGTERDVSTEGLLPMTLWDDGREIYAVAEIVYLTATYTGTPTNALIEHDSNMSVWFEGRYQLDGLIDDHSGVTSGEWTLLSGETVWLSDFFGWQPFAQTPEEIETVIRNNGNAEGLYLLQFKVEVRLTLTFTGGTTDSIRQGAEAHWTVEYSHTEGLSSLQVTVSLGRSLR